MSHRICQIMLRLIALHLVRDLIRELGKHLSGLFGPGQFLAQLHGSRLDGSQVKAHMQI